MTLPETVERGKTSHVEKLTFLRACEQSEFGKKYRLEDGAYAEVRLNHETFWSAESLRVNSLKDVFDLLKARSHEKNICIVHGAPIEGVDTKRMRRQNVTLIDAPHRTVFLDFDNVATSEREGEALARFVRASLPPEFRDAACIWNLTASHGIKGARVRLIFWTDKPVSLAQIKAWLGGSGADASIWRAVQPVYIGANVEADPFNGKRWGKLDGAPAVNLPDGLPEQSDEVGTYERPKLAVEGAKVDAPHMLEQWASTVASRTAERVAEDGRRNSFRLAGLDGHNRALSAETLETLLGLWFAPDDDDAHAEAIAVLDDLGADRAIADRLANAGRAIDWDAGEPLGPEHVAAQIKSAFATAQNEFGAAYKAEVGEKFGAANDDDTASFLHIERARAEFDMYDHVTADTAIKLGEALRADGVKPDEVVRLRREVAKLNNGDKWLGTDGELFAMIADAAREAKWNLETSVSPKALFAIADDIADNFRPMEYSVRGLLPRRGIGFFHGPSHGGKSFTVIDLGAHLATGKDWLGYKIKKEYAVLYVCGEGREGIDQRVKAWKLKNGGFGGNFAVMNSPPNLFTNPKDAEKKIVEAAKRLAERSGVEVALIIFDTVASLCAGMEENSAKEVGTLTQTMRGIATKADAAVMGVHHTGLGDKTRGRGSTALYGNADFELLIKVTPDDPTKPVETRTLFNTKNRDHARAHGGHRFTLEQVKVGEYADDHESIYSLVFAPAPPTLAVEDADDEQDEVPTIAEMAGDGASEYLNERQARFMEVAREFGRPFMRDEFVPAYNRRFKGVDDMSEDKFKRAANSLKGSYLELDANGARKDWRWRVLEDESEADV